MRLPPVKLAALILVVAFPGTAPAPQFLDGNLPQGLVYTALAAPLAGDVWGSSQLMLREPNGRIRPLSAGFRSAADPEVSYDGKRLLFAAQRSASERWQIFEQGLDGSAVRQLTRLDIDCRHPVYQSRFFTLDAPSPWDQVAFVAGGQVYTVPLGAPAGPAESAGHVEPQPVTFLPGEARELAMAPDGRVLFSYLDRHGKAARLFAVNLDGTDVALLNGEAPASMRMASVGPNYQLAFIESKPVDPFGMGPLSTISLLRPQRSYQRAAIGEHQQFHSPSFLPDGSVLAARQDGDRLALFHLDSSITKATRIHADPLRNLVQPKIIAPRALPDGRGSVVDPSVSWAVLYCLNVYKNDLAPAQVMLPGSVRRVRVLQKPEAGGVPIGEAPVEADGSFHVRVPANRPLLLELLDAENRVIRRGAWIYARNKEARGCIGCHEDPELTPSNREALAVLKPAVDLTHAAEATVETGGAP
ncbi:MAG: PD40 domain-containing protein [Bryobacterales bacterium]|nr:PD40 domain-containing protein [Bryobacterales bacterium]